MKKLVLNLIIFIFCSFFYNISYSAELYGMIKTKNGFLEKGTKIEIIGKKNYKTKVKQNGNFRIKIDETGKLILHIHYKNKISTFKVISTHKARRYDLILIKKEKKYLIKRH